MIPGQFPQARPPPPYGPRPRNVFYPRSPGGQTPPLPGSPGPQGQPPPGQFPSPQGSVPPSPNQPGPPQGFPGPRFIQNPNIRGPPPSQRPPFPGNNPQQPFFQRNGSEHIRGPGDFGPNQKLQRNDSVANLNPRYPIPAERRPQLIPQISIERMADEGSKIGQSDAESPKKLLRENDDDDDVIVDSEKSKIETPKSSPVSSRQGSLSSEGNDQYYAMINII